MIMFERSSEKEVFGGTSQQFIEGAHIFVIFYQ